MLTPLSLLRLNLRLLSQIQNSAFSVPHNSVLVFIYDKKSMRHGIQNILNWDGQLDLEEP